MWRILSLCRKRNKIVFLLSVLWKPSLFLLISFLPSCESKSPPPVRYAVSIGDVIKKDVPVSVKAVGQLRASLETQLKPQVEGILTQVAFVDGALVEEGEVLLAIDPRPYQAALSQAQAQLAEDEAKLRYARDFAKTYGSLVGKEYVARLDYAQGVQNVAVYEATLLLDQARIAEAQLHLDKTQIRAPFKGYVGNRTYDPGAFVSPTQNTPLVTLRQITPLNVFFSLPARYLYTIRTQQSQSALPLRVELPDQPGEPLEGTLVFIDNTVHPQTGMIALKGTLPNLEEKGWPGQFARVYLQIGTLTDAVLAPQEALILGQNGTFAFVFHPEKNQVSLRMVGTGLLYEGWQVITWGLEPGERVVTDGQLNLYEGAYVFLAERGA